MNTVALYARVSTQRQVEEATIASQIAEVEKYAQSQGWVIAPEHYFIDEGVSGTTLNRPGLNRLRDLASIGAFTTVLCLSPDRLSRNLGVQYFLLERWKQLNVKVVFTNRPTSGQTPHEVLLLNIEGIFAEYEHTVITDRMQRGRRHRLQQGATMPYPAPYGYGYLPATPGQGSRWQMNAAQAAIVRQIFLWYTQENISIYEISKRLNEQCIPSPQNKQWCYSSVRAILCHSVYKGVVYYGRTQQDHSGVGLPRRRGNGRLQHPRYQLRPVGEWIEMTVPALVEEALWQQAQEIRQMNALTARRNSHEIYVLRGVLVCGVCGTLLQGRKQNQQRYYRCRGGGKDRAATVPAHTCTLRADVAEAQIWQALAQLLDHPERIQAAWDHHRQSLTQPPTQLVLWQKRQQLLQTQRRRLIDAYQNEQLSLEELTERQNPIQIELRKLDQQLATAQQADTLEISLDQFTAQIRRALQSDDAKLKQEIIQLLIERVVVEDDALIIEHIIPTKDNSQLESVLCPSSIVHRLIFHRLIGYQSCSIPPLL